MGLTVDDGYFHGALSAGGLAARTLGLWLFVQWAVIAGRWFGCPSMSESGEDVSHHALRAVLPQFASCLRMAGPNSHPRMMRVCSDMLGLSAAL